MLNFKKSLKLILVAGLLVLGCLTLGKNPAATSAASAENFLLAWTTNSFVPDEFAGRALPTRGSYVKVVALPTKKLSANPDALYYRWLLDGNVMGWASGVGKSSFRFKVTKWTNDTHTIESQILNGAEGQIVFSRTLNLTVVAPSITLKEPSNDYAISDTYSLRTGRDLLLTATPFFFHAQSLADLNFAWKIDDQQLASPDEKNLNKLLIQIPAGELNEGFVKDLLLAVVHKTDELQQISVNLRLKIQ